MKISVIVGTYNEAQRLPGFLSHATKWADEVIVVDKSSTDETRELANAGGAKVVQVPFSRSGFEDPRTGINAANNDWCFCMTPGEVPTPGLIQAVKELLASRGNELDLIAIPKKLYSFGIHDTDSPWSVSYQPFLLHRKRAHISTKTHANFSLKPGGRGDTIPFSEDCHVLHPTHATVESFLRSHFDYILAVIEGCPVEACEEKIREAYRQMNGNQFGGPKYDLLGQHAAWNLYWSGIALAAFEKRRGANIPEQYKRMASDALNQWL